MHSILIKSLLLSLLLMARVAHSALPETIAVWSNKNGDAYAVYTSELYKDDWTTPVVVAESDNRIIASAIGSSSFVSAAEITSGDEKSPPQGMIVVWTEVIGERWLLKYATHNGETWTLAQALTSLHGENLAPMIVHDLAGNPWVFWSSNASGDDDIYLTRRIDGRWSKTDMVNQANLFPDIIPNTYLADNGDIVVEWDTLDTTANQFVINSRVYPTNANAAVAPNQNLETINQDLPDYAYTAARINLHYPMNKFTQSVFYSKSQ